MEKNSLADNVTNNFLQREILINTEDQFMKESNSLVSYANIKQLQWELLIDTKGHYMKESNTSLAAKGALANRLQRRTSCKIQNGRQGAPKWQRGS